MRFRETRKVVAANAGIGGPVIYLTEHDDWTQELHDAEILDDGAHAQLRLLLGMDRRIPTIDLRFVDVCSGPDGPELVGRAL